jgi:hypothetical protein
MTTKELHRRLLQALMQYNPAMSVRFENSSAIYLGELSIEFTTDRVVIGPRIPHLTAEAVRTLTDPDSILWFVARFDDPDFAGRVARFLKRRGLELAPDWLAPPAEPPAA